MDPYDVRYHNAERTAVFCDAYCSHKWYTKLKEEEEKNEKQS